VYITLRVIYYNETVSVGCILTWGCFNLYCNVWVFMVCVCLGVGFVMCIGFCNICTCI
jgi:hypothetical protein